MVSEIVEKNIPKKKKKKTILKLPAPTQKKFMTTPKEKLVTKDDSIKKVDKIPTTTTKNETIPSRMSFNPKKTMNSEFKSKKNVDITSLDPPDVSLDMNKRELLTNVPPFFR